MFIVNILASLIEIVATCGDCTIIKFEYDGHSSIVEKSLMLKHILGFHNDLDFVHDNFRPEMGLKEIARNVKDAMDNKEPTYSKDPKDKESIPVNDYYTCVLCK